MLRIRCTLENLPFYFLNNKPLEQRPTSTSKKLHEQSAAPLIGKPKVCYVVVTCVAEVIWQVQIQAKLSECLCTVQERGWGHPKV